MNNPQGPMPAALRAWQETLRTRWRALAPREQQALLIAGLAVALLLVWLVLLQPALRTIRSAPAQIDTLEVQLQQMQRLATEARELRGTAPTTVAESTAALQAATVRLGDRGRLAVTGERATLTLNGANGELLRDWLTEARSGARARPVQAQLTRGPAGYSGSIVVALGGSAS